MFQGLLRFRRTLLIVSPFLAIVVTLVWLAMTSIDILAAGRAYVEGESLWSKNQQEAVFYLLRYAETGADIDYHKYEAAMTSPLGYRQARVELEKPNPDYALVRAGFLAGGTNREDIPGVIWLYQRFHNVGYMKQVLDIWRIGDKFLARLNVAAAELHAWHHSSHPDLAARNAILNRIFLINTEVRPWENRFSETLGEATRWLQRTLLVVLLAVAGALVPLGVLLTQRMVTRVESAERELEELRLREEYGAKLAYHASHDPLTSLVNRLEFEKRVKQALQTAATRQKQHVVMYLDLDQFKVVNDTAGHAAGDQLLRQLSSLLKARVRDGDTIARLGGDEFGVLLESCQLQDAIRIADDLRQCVAGFRFVSEEGSFGVGASIGVVQIGDDMLNLTEVLSAADAACYMAKDKGRNRVQLYSPHDSEVSMRRGELQWVSRVKHALEEGRFTLHAQRILPIGERHAKATHHELLLRMLDEYGTPIPPMAFIPAAERYSMMPLIDEWVIKNAFARISTLGRGAGVFAINVSGMSIGDERFLEFVREQFRRYAMLPRSICFELTETAAVTNFDKAARFFGEMKALGCLFSLDDFGAGMSSFGYLRHLPVDFIKIDGSFVQGLTEDRVDAATVRAINDMAHVMGKQTIAEFVEGEAALAVLREIGVDFAQGNSISPPQPFAEESAVPRPRTRERQSGRATRAKSVASVIDSTT